MSETPTELWRRVSRAFDEVAAAQGEERARRLAELAMSDPAVHREIVALLEADPGTSRFLEGAIAAPGEEPAAVGQRIGGWRIVAPLGRGGMGEVFVAERADGAYRKQAALKRLRRGLDTDSLVARFLRERQILASLDHPGIARLLDGGVAEDGRPYFVLELVDGEPIVAWADAQRLDAAGRVRLLLDVCAAVEAAHRRLVVHRDLKPSNVLVDGAGRVRLLDFGVAKLLDPEEGDAAATHLGAAPMTPAYAAPEQILGGPVTTATDVYALGVLLFELLTGERPHERQGRTPTELVAELGAERPAPASERVARRAREATAGAERARLERRARELRGDLDAILLLALEPEATRRTPTVGALAADLQRYLAKEPVTARGPARGYRLRKFVGRHRTSIAAAALVVLSLVVGLAAALVQARRARAEARAAESARSFLVELFEAVDPGRSRGTVVTAREVLDAGVRRLATDSGDPRTHAALAEALARSYLGLGEVESAGRWARAALEVGEQAADPAATARAELLGAEIDVVAGRLEPARERLEALRPRMARAFGPDSAEVLAAGTLRARVSELAGEPGDDLLARRRALFELAERVHGHDHPKTADALAAYGYELTSEQGYEAAEAALRDAYARCQRSRAEKTPEGIRVGTYLAHVLDIAGKDDEAVALYDRLEGVATELLGPEHPQVADVLTEKGTLLIENGRLEEAEAALDRAAGIFRRLDHYDLGAVLRYLGYVSMARERFDEALARFEEAERQLAPRLGADHPLVWTTRMSRAEAEARLGRLGEAEALLREVVAAQERIHGPRTSEVRQTLKRLGDTLRRAGRPAEAIELLERSLAIERELFGTDEHLGVATTKMQLALARLARQSEGDLASARREADEALAYLRSRPGEHERIGRALWLSGQVAAAEGDGPRALRELERAVEILTERPGPGAPSTVGARADLEAARRAPSRSRGL